MKKPIPAPSLNALMKQVKMERLGELISASFVPDDGKKYPHWNDLIHLQPPSGFSHEEWWISIKLRRNQQRKPVDALHDDAGKPFQFQITDSILEELHKIDLGGGGHIGMPEVVTNPETRDKYYVASLIEEAITSSQLEGAATTRQVAKEMIRTARAPQGRDERMILNNFHAMQAINRLKADPLTPELVFELHRIVTTDVLDDSTGPGRLRRADENIVVTDLTDGVLHVPPSADTLSARLMALCDFGNGAAPQGFVHPVIRSIILHFWLAYDHPFIDGNGRVARALFYWSMLHHGYWLYEYISISRILRKAPIQYARAFLYTESDDNDLTYFLLYQVDVLRRALRDLHSYIEATAARAQTLERTLQGLTLFNHRQRALLSHALRHPQFRYTIEGHRLSHSTSYQTARTDLLLLEQRGLMRGQKVGKTWFFTPQTDLEKRLETGPL